MSALIIAIVGVIGTLVAPIVSQRLSARARQEDFIMQEKQRNDDRLNDERQQIRNEKRNCYVSVMATARQYRYEIVKYFYAIQNPTPSSDLYVDLEKARQAYVLSFADAQLTASLEVLAAIEPFNLGLSRAYRAVSQLKDGRLDPARGVDNPELFLTELLGYVERNARSNEERFWSQRLIHSKCQDSRPLSCH